jgi:uncharacterized protein (TIGR00251 family)
MPIRFCGGPLILFDTGVRLKRKDRIYLNIKVQPRSHKQDITQTGAGSYRVRVVAPPSRGKANKEVIKIIADHFGLPASQVHIVRGKTIRDKVVAIEREHQEQR